MTSQDQKNMNFIINNKKKKITCKINIIVFLLLLLFVKIGNKVEIENYYKNHNNNSLVV